MRLPSPNSIYSIVVRCPNWIGDAVMATPALEDIRNLFPSARITVLASEPIAELLENLPCIDEFIIFSRAQGEKTLEFNRIIQELKKREYDLGILLTRSFSSAWMYWKGNVRWRLGFKDHWRSLLLNIAVSLPKEEEHDVFTYRKLLSPFGLMAATRQPMLVVTEDEKAQMQKTLQPLCKDKDLIVLNPGAAYGSAKCWPKERFRGVAEALLTQGKSVIFIGDAKTRALIDEIMDGLSGPVFNFAGRTTIRQLIALLYFSRVVVSNDSGPMHIAAALGKPLVAIFGSTNPKRTGPFATGLVIKKEIPCSPCYKRVCPKNFECMTSISVEEVLEAIEKVYGNT